MKYVIFQYFFMVHLYNMKISAAIIHSSKDRHYDIDTFISELLASRKFDELAEKLAEKAANKIMHLDSKPPPVKRATGDNEGDNSSEHTQEANKKPPNREDVNEYKNTHFNNVELRKDFRGKIDPQAVINASISLSENLQLKYKYFKQNALEKKLKSNRDPLPKSDLKVDLTKANKTIGPTDFKDHYNKAQVLMSNQNVTNEKLMNAEEESRPEHDRYHDDTKNDNLKDDFKGNVEANEGGMDLEINDSSKKPDQQSPGHEQIVFREAQDSIPPNSKGIAELETSHAGNVPGKENQKHLEINEDENAIAEFIAHNDNIEKNKVKSDHNSNRGGYGIKASDNLDDRSPEERSPEEQSGEDPNSSKPVIRKEGDKLYTYVKGPEYEDYHEDLAKWQKEHPDNPTDFI